MIKAVEGKERYLRWYEALCARGQVRILTSGFERHHVVPRALGGTNDKANLTKLTYREHFLAHWLLTRFTEGEALHKMRYALNMMIRASGASKTRVVAGWQFEVARRAVAVPRPASVKAKISAASSGRVFSEEHRAKLRAAKLGRKRPPHTAETRAKIGAFQRSWQDRGPHSEAHKAKIGAKSLGRKHTAEARAKIVTAWVARKAAAQALITS